jgi:hypothetical protein
VSSTVNIGGLKTDPITIEWQGAEVRVQRVDGTRTLSKFRSALLTFPVLTSSQYNAWKALCDDNTDHTLTSFPGICTSTYSTDPGAYDGTTYTPENGVRAAGLTFTGEYRLHFMGSRHSTGVYIYDTSILIYLRRATQCPIPIELGGCQG